MALSIRNSRAEMLAREVAKESGENITQAIIHALEERLERVRGRRLLSDITEDIMAISERCKAFPELDTRSEDEILGYSRKGTFDHGN